MIADLVEQIPEADFDIASDDSQGQVEIIGWLYQYYNQEPHNDVVNINGGPVKERDIPAATQLFTTDWVVRYMVDNSLGRYYLEHTPNSKLADHLDYLVPGELHSVNEALDLSQLRVLDNAMGSGHILVYAFDVLMHIYEEQGFSRRESAIQIAMHNLYGLEIDKRAYQLAYFAVMMKVRQYDRRALTRELKLNLHVFMDSKNLQPELIDQLPLAAEAKVQLNEICSVFRDAKTLGSIMQFPRQYDVSNLLAQLDAHAGAAPANIFASEGDLAQLRETVEIVGVLQGKYDAVVTNPPYLNRMDKTLKDYVKKYYKAYSGDLFSVFIWLNINMTRKDGYAGYMTPFVWMFIKTYEALRTDVLDTMTISSLVQMEYSAFEEATVPIDTFVLKNSRELTGTYLKLSDFKGGMQVQGEKVLEAIADPSVKYLYRANQANFGKIPGSPIAYWASANLLHDFEVGTPMAELVDPRQGLATADNNRFLRQWFEVAYKNIKFDARSIKESVESKRKWFPYNKGGAYRKWYGNYDYVVNWEDDGREIRSFTDSKGKVRSRPQNTNYYFREAITWSDITSGAFSMRYVEPGSLFGTVGLEAFPKSSEVDIKVLMGLCNTKMFNYILSIINPTLHLVIGNLSISPVIIDDPVSSHVLEYVEDNINLVKSDWNASECAWDFASFGFLSHIAEHPLAIRTKFARGRPFVPILCQPITIKDEGVNDYGQLS
ncbi:BREX-1 system adenine-specific DNA-methyltransferase PglX [Lacticaseibacillus kribbianus]|uniref:BREX-1 system adenine-specific DNA-methyltransferase PglX n=1 Tax=Lacticaseibacillus kribbianus TaxID=2926292 RepID=UPI001CD1F7DD